MDTREILLMVCAKVKVDKNLEMIVITKGNGRIMLLMVMVSSSIVMVQYTKAIFKKVCATGMVNQPN
jgi:hypothetical protein